MLWNRVNSYGFYVYWNNWEVVIGEILKACMEPQNEVDKYTMAVVDKENNIIGHLPKGKVWNMQKQYFTFWYQISWTFAMLKLQERLEIWETTKGSESLAYYNLLQVLKW